MKQNLILYECGAYGTFFEWIFNFIEGTTSTLPLESTGSSHLFVGNLLHPKEKIFEYINSDNKNRFSRCHPNIFEFASDTKGDQWFNTKSNQPWDKVLQEDLDFLKNHFDKILVLTFSKSSMLWIENNYIDKTFLSDNIFKSRFEKYGYLKESFNLQTDPIEFIRHQIDYNVDRKRTHLTIENLKKWNKTSIFDFDIWELRELLALQYFHGVFIREQAWKTVSLNNDDVKFIFIDSLRDKFIDTILTAAEYFNLNVTARRIEELKEIHKSWAKLQKQIDKDSICNQIVTSIIANDFFDWSTHSLSIIDEAWVQKSLSDNSIQIKCWNLNTFPTNTKDFEEYLIR